MAYTRSYKSNSKQQRYAARWTKSNGLAGEKRGFTSKREAQRFADAQEVVERQIRNKQRRAYRGPITLGDFVQDVYSKSLEVKRSTKENYQWALNKHILPKFGSIALVDIKPADIKEWRNELRRKRNQVGNPLSESYVNKITFHLGMILNCAVDNDFIPSSPMKKIRIKKNKSIKNEIKPLTYKQVLSIVEQMSERFRLIVWIGFYTGMRPSEILGLTWDNINFKSREIYVVRQLSRYGDEVFTESLKTTASHRTIFLVDDLAKLIKAHVDKYGLGPHNLLFKNRLGGILRYRDAADRFRIAARPLGLQSREGLHILRHTCVSNLINFGFSPKKIQKWVGHETISETMDTYGHLFPDYLKSIGEELDANFESLKTKVTGNFTTVA
jgi:integrase